MNEEWIIPALKSGLINYLAIPNGFDKIILIDKSLHNNQARWSVADHKLYVSPAAHVLLLDSETFDAVIEGLEIN